MMRHFVAFSLLLFVLEISVEATLVVPLCVFIGDSVCQAACLKQAKCQNGHCKEELSGKICVCEDCPGGRQAKEKFPGLIF